MIAKARLLMRSASFRKLRGFVLISVIPVFLIGSSGSLITMAVPELAQARPGLSGAYLVEVFGALWPVLYALVGAFAAFWDYRTFLNTVAPCEPAVALWIQAERQAPAAMAIPEVEVLDSDGVIVLCRDCEEVLNGAGLRRLIHQHYRPGAKSWS